jgi:hypothetical protein
LPGEGETSPVAQLPDTVVDFQALTVAADADFASFEAEYDGTAIAVISAVNGGKLSLHVLNGATDVTSALCDGNPLTANQLKFVPFTIEYGASYSLQLSEAGQVTMHVIAGPVMLAQLPLDALIDLLNGILAAVTPDNVLNVPSFTTTNAYTTMFDFPCAGWRSVILGIINTGANSALLKVNAYIRSSQDNYGAIPLLSGVTLAAGNRQLVVVDQPYGEIIVQAMTAGMPEFGLSPVESTTLALENLSVR